MLNAARSLSRTAAAAAARGSARRVPHVRAMAADARRRNPSDAFGQVLQRTLDDIHAAGTYKKERVITSQQAADIVVNVGKRREVINFCANNYLGLANNPRLIAAAKDALDSHGLGVASVRFICGTQDIHKTLESRISQFHGTDDTILYSSAFDANGGLFETILGEEDAVISDELNHASIIDGVRLCKAKRFRYKHMDMADLEAQLRAAASARNRLITTVRAVRGIAGGYELTTLGAAVAFGSAVPGAQDGVFSMDGHVAPLRDICDLADKYNAIVHVDECHATGLFGPTGRGTAEHCGVQDRIAVITSTIGKALGGSSGGFTTGRGDIIEVLRQRSRPYLFSNSIAPPIVGAAIACFDMLLSSSALVQRLQQSTQYFRHARRSVCGEALTKAKFSIRPSPHPIVPVMLGDARLASEFADRMLDKGIYVIGFSYPVVPKDKARIRVQISAAHTREHLDKAINAFVEVRRELGAEPK